MTINLPNSYSEAGAELRMASLVFPEAKVQMASHEKTSLSAGRSAKGKAKLIERMTPRMKEEFESFDPSLQDAIFRYCEGGLTDLQLALKFLEYHPALCKTFAYNEHDGSIVRKTAIPDLDLPVGKKSSVCKAVPVTYNDQINLISWFELYGLRLKKEAFMAQLEAFSKKRSFNPIQRKLEKFRNAWDSQSRLDTFFSHVFHVEDSFYYKELGRRFMVGAVARALCGKEPYKFDWMPVLSGGQGLGKSLFCRTLFGNMLKEGLPANLSDKDAKQELQHHWCVEISELTSFKKTTNEVIKSFLTTMVDTYRPPYGKDVVSFPRHCVFIGTTNEEEFLTDTTGNRRFMPIFLDQPIDIEWLIQNREHLWGEAYASYLEEPDLRTDISPEVSKAAKPFHERATAKDMLEEKVLRYLSDIDPHSFNGVSSLDQHDGKGFSLADLAGELSMPINRSSDNRLSTILKKNGYERSQERIGENRMRLWRLKEESSETDGS